MILQSQFEFIVNTLNADCQKDKLNSRAGGKQMNVQSKTPKMQRR